MAKFAAPSPTGYLVAGLSVVASAAVIEAALVPGIVIGAAAVLVPRYLSRPGRRPHPCSNANVRRRRTDPAASTPEDRQAVKALPSAPSGLRIKRAIAKTITFRIIVTTLDFTANYVVLGELAAAAGLSALALVAGPVFYFVHETAWDYIGPPPTDADVPLLFLGRKPAKPSSAGRGVFSIHRAIAKTITFRTIATIVDFTVNYAVVGDVATAAGLSAFGFVVGPFVYLGHERAWDYWGSGPMSSWKTGTFAGQPALA
jgi:uncharacterized membrane protein